MDIKSPANFALWALGVFVFAIIARVGWEFGGRLFGAF